ncbi:helix-turn-helix domain-containing protein [Paenibacillus paeoniae]|nr:AraC family transcriptional regulator [Paenibacillus paeoniae]
MRASHSSIPIGSLLFQLTDSTLIHSVEIERIERSVSDSYLLLVFRKGEGQLIIGDDLYRIQAKQSFCLLPGMNFSIENKGRSVLQYFQLSFRVIYSEEGRMDPYAGPLWSDQGPLKAYPFTRMMQIAEQLVECVVEMDGIERFKRNQLFQELIGFLLEQHHDSKGTDSPLHAVESSIQYVNHHFTDSLTVRELASRAELPYWQYSSIFRELTGVKPNDYIAELRMTRAKEMLLRTDAPLREIASQTGFVDEYYFSRRFRQSTGFAPRQYVAAMRKKISVRDWTGHEVHIPAHPNRIVFYGETIGDLLSLGIKPVGCSYSLKGTWYEEELQAIVNVGTPLELGTVEELSPDLIIYANTDEGQYKDVAKIAPTVTFDSFQPLEDRLITLGHWFGKRREAETWLHRFEHQSEEMWRELEPAIRNDETASVFTYHRGNRLFVMGTIGLTETLYHPLGFRPTKRVQSLRNQHRAYQEISESQIRDYAGNRVFLILPADPTSRESTEALWSSSLWNSLEAVQEGHAYLVEESKWNIGDAFTREKLLERLPALLTESS